MKTGTPSDPISLQKFEYNYEPVGNVNWIKDYKAGGTQTQTFTYDNLNRLDTASASGGDGFGMYNENYDYDPGTGNLSKKGTPGTEGNYNYPDASHQHTVRRVTGSGGTSKTIQVRAYSTPCNDGVRATMELRVNGSLVSTWTNVAASWTTYSASATLSGKDQIEVVFTNDCAAGGYDRNLYVDYVVVDGQTIQAEGSGTLIDWGTGSAAYDGLSMALGSQNLTSNGALRLVKGAGAYAAGYDLNGNMTSRILDGAAYLLAYDAENRMTGVSGAATATFVYDRDGNRVKGTVAGVTTTYIGNYFEWTGKPSTMKKYYYAGSTRIAVRTGAGTNETGLQWLFGDHLGSTSRVANADGSTGPEQRYKPWGEKRPAGASSLPTT